MLEEGDFREKFKEIFAEKGKAISPYPEQLELAKKLFVEPRDKVKIVEAKLPTGYGKTEAALFPFFLQALEDRWLLSARLIYVLPMQALCNQIKERIERYSYRIKELTGRELRVEVQHGSAPDDPYYIGDIVVTTFDQFLYGYARAKQHLGRHIDLPAGSIALSYVVFDEAHLYSPYTHALMRGMLEILHSAQVPTLVMTATMPSTLEHDLLKGLTSSDYQIGFRGTSYIPRRLTLRLSPHPLIKEDGHLEALLKFACKYCDKKIIIACNRVATAQRVYEELSAKRIGKPLLIHSRFIHKDRNKKEKLVDQLFGKSSGSEPAILVTTQVCEAGLDISADILLTECSPADSLIQRVGRIARWGGEGEVVIFAPSPGNSGKNYPYYDEITEIDYVELTWKELNHKIPDLTDWKETLSFADKMPYRVNEGRAHHALGDLLDATLYADQLPQKLAAREDRYITICVLKLNKDQTSINPNLLKDHSFRLPYGIAQRLKNSLQDFIKAEIGNYARHEGGYTIVKRPPGLLFPFRTYLLNPEYYSETIGLMREKK